jgi:imidazolonepropionase-like amidohydrolase
MLKSCFRVALLLAVLTPLGDLNRQDQALASARQANATAFVGINVIPMNEERVIASQTLNAFDLVAPQFGATPAERALIVQHRRQMVKALHEAGAKLLAGTDAGTNVTVAGTGLIDELAELVTAGLSPHAALRTATANAAEFLGKADQRSRGFQSRMNCAPLCAVA